MSNGLEIPVLALDGGGTHCRLALDTGSTRQVVEAGAANVSTDFAGAVAQIETALGEMARLSGLVQDELSDIPAFVGLAGVVSASLKERLKAALPFRKVRIEDDRPAALRGALGQRDGCLVHCGTGSFFAYQSAGHIRFVGGWGAALGDEASAQWLGRKALTVTLAQLDGLHPESDLSSGLLDTFGGAAGIVEFASQARPDEFGALAPHVTQAADQGDPLAQIVMELGAQEIVHTLLALGWDTGHALCLTGGLGAFYAPYLPAKMQDALVDPEGAPLDGAVALARDFVTDTRA